MVLIVTRFVDPSLLDDRIPWLEKAFGLLETMIAGGNRIADFRMRELHRLDEMLAEYLLIQEHRPNPSANPMGTNNQRMAPGILYSEDVHCARDLMASPNGMPLYSGFSDESSGFGDDLSAEQILAVADSMDIESTDWLSFAVLENYQITEPHQI